jgi:serpin B
MSLSLFRKLSFIASCCGIGSIAVWGCGGSGDSSSQNRSLPPAVAQAVSRSTPVDNSLVAANNSVGFDLFGKLVQQDPTSNVFISPTSIALALEIVENGAEGDTLTAMAQTLHLSGMAVADVDAANAALQASLVNPDPKTTLTIANSLWIHKDSAQVAPTFLQTNTTYYGSAIGDLAGAPNSINSWVNAQTNGTIPSIVGPDDYSKYVAIVVNAVYFKGQWSTQFDPAATTNAPFTLLDGSTKTCKLMNRSDGFSYYRGSNFQVARLPYGSQRLSMVVVLPDKGVDWHSFLATVTPQSLNSWLTQTAVLHGRIELPRFQSNYQTDLIPPLTALGMGVAFTPQADLSGIAPGLQIMKAQHKTFLQVDEQGTVAAAATSVGAVATAVPVDLFTMTMDHPFFCAIRDEKTGVLLFLGCILDPTAVSSN